LKGVGVEKGTKVPGCVVGSKRDKPSASDEGAGGWGSAVGGELRRKERGSTHSRPAGWRHATEKEPSHGFAKDKMKTVRDGGGEGKKSVRGGGS